MRVRRSSRLILLDPEDRLLLFQVVDASIRRPGEPRREPFWITPGGGLEPGEGHETAALRELREETGLVGVEVGPWVALCEPVLNWAGETLRAHDRFYLVRIGTMVEEVSLVGMGEAERAVHREYRWWPLPDLLRSEARVVPAGLPNLAARLAAGDIPRTPVRLA